MLCAFQEIEECYGRYFKILRICINKLAKDRGELNVWYARDNFNYNSTSGGLSYILGNKINN